LSWCTTEPTRHLTESGALLLALVIAGTRMKVNL